MQPTELIRAIPADTAVAFALADGSHGFGHAQDVLFPAASVIKVAILAAFFAEVEAGRCDPHERLNLAREDMVGGAGVLFEFEPGLQPAWLDLARLMIVVSDNTASNLLLRRLQMKRVNAFMKAAGCRGRFGRYFMEAPSVERDNSLTAADALCCLRLFVEPGLLGERWRGAGLEILRRQQYREKIPLKLPPDLPVAHKTGELEGVRHDAALVEHPRHPYFLAVLTRDGAEPWAVDMAIADLSRYIYDWVDKL